MKKINMIGTIFGLFIDLPNEVKLWTALQIIELIPLLFAGNFRAIVDELKPIAPLFGKKPVLVKYDKRTNELLSIEVDDTL